MVTVLRSVAAMLLVAAGLASGAAPCRAQGHTVLVLLSFNPALPWSRSVLEGIERERLATEPPAATVYVETLDRLRLPETPTDAEWAAFLARKYRNTPPDVIIADSYFALKLLATHGDTMFGPVPRVVLRVRSEDLSGVEAAVKVTSGPFIERTLALALAQRPQTRRVVLVSDRSASSLDLVRQAEKALAEHAGVTAERLLSTAGLDAMGRAVAALPDDALILYLPVFRDQGGNPLVPRKIAEALADRASVPIYVLHETLIGTGAVGGYVYSGHRAGQEAMRAAAALLRTPPSPSDGTQAGQERIAAGYVFDWRALQRWRIDPDGLPASAELRDRPPALFDAYFHETLLALGAIGALVALAALILSLYVQRGRLMRALRASNEHLEMRVAERTHALATATEELHAAVERAEAATKAKSAFLATMSHEIRTPLNAMAGLTHLLLKTGLTDRQRDFLQQIRSAADTLLALITQILDYSKVESGKLRLDAVAFDLEAVLRQAAGVASVAIGDKPITLTVTVAPTVPHRLHGDALRLGQVLTNVLHNAVKFTQAGEVTLTVTAESFGANRVRLCCAVRDTGVGLTPDQCQRVFDAFTQADTATTRRFGGTGLGLALCKQLIELMGGHIGVDSVPGVGSTFHFTAVLGLTPPEHSPADPDRPAAARGTGPAPARELGALDGLHVLVAEDNATNRDILLELLRAVGVDAACADSGAETIARLQADPERYDAVLMDVHMPDLDGLAATRRIRTRHGADALPIIALTADTLEEDRQACLAAGMNDHLGKPVDPEHLYATLSRWCRRRPRADRTSPPAADAPDAGTKRVHPRANPSGTDPSAREAIATRLAELETLVAGHNVRALQRFAALRDALDASGHTPALTALGRSLERFDFNAASADLQRLKAALGPAAQPGASGATPDAAPDGDEGSSAR